MAHYEITQMGMIVADLDTTMRHYHDTFGWGPWKIYEYRKPWLHDLKWRGQPADFTWMGAEAHAGGAWIELLQPLEGDSPLARWLADNGDGVHHVGYEAATIDQARQLHRSFTERGMTELVSAFCGDMYFFYMDARPLVIEVWAGSADDLTPDRTYP
jgi:methylmalonyl-CoA/ethylmalonyl-CoA epimerase